MRKCQAAIAPNILTIKFRSQPWETSLARFLILLINNNPAKCCHLILSSTCVFSNGQFYDQCRICRCPILILSLLVSPPSCPLFRLDIKLIESRAKIIN
jgi:hypothetical protein